MPIEDIYFKIKGNKTNSLSIVVEKGFKDLIKIKRTTYNFLF